MKVLFEKLLLSILAKPRFERFNNYFLTLGHRVLGINNYRSDKDSGEEFWLKHFISHNKESNIFDVGAHKGDYAIMANEMGFKGKIYCFEPHPSTFTVLTSRTSQFSNVIPVNSGLSDATKTDKLYDYQKDPEHNSGTEHATLFAHVITDMHRNANISEISIHLTTLDAFVLEKGIERIGLLKIDTEGNELRVLQGAKKMLASKKIDVIQFEFGEMNVISRVFFKDFYDLLQENYLIYRLLPNTLLPITKYDARYHEIFIYQNLVAIRKDLKQ